MKQRKEKIAADLEALTVPIEWVRPMEGNPRRGDVDAVARSYNTFGQRKPVVVRRTGEQDGHPVGDVIAGNHQLAAARKLGWSRIAVVWMEDDEKTAKAFAVADNRVSDLGAYDPTALAEALDELKADPELLKAASYDPADLEKVVVAEAANATGAGAEKNKVKRESMDSLQDRYASRDSRSFMAEFPIPVYEWVVEKLSDRQEAMGNATWTEAIIDVVREATGEEVG